MNDTEPILTPTRPRPVRKDWIDLGLYLVLGPALLLLVSLGLARVFKGHAVAVEWSYLLNILFFAGVPVLVTTWRKTFTWEELGIAPVRWRWRWLVLAGGVVIVLLPVRAGLGLLVQSLLPGGLESLMQGARMQTLVPQTFTWSGFLSTILLGGILVPAAEELFFRGAIHTWVRRFVPPCAAVLISSTVFALGHADTFVVILTSFILGAVNAVLLDRTRSLWVPFAVHALNNSLAFALVYLAAAVQSSGLIP